MDVGAHDAPGGDRGNESLRVPFEYVPRRAADVLEIDMGDGIILYSRDSDLVHHLNFSAGLVWQLCTADASVAELAADIAGVYDLPGKQVSVEVATVVAEFDALGLVVDARAADPEITEARSTVD